MKIRIAVTLVVLGLLNQYALKLLAQTNKQFIIYQQAPDLQVSLSQITRALYLYTSSG